MNNLIAIVIIFVVSIILGSIKFTSLDTKNWKWQRKFVEIWNDFVNFIIPGLIGYYFILVRWPLLLKGDVINAGDFGLFVIFILGLFGHLCVMSINITNGVEAILKRVLERK
jgi:hypothetical protein